MKKNNIRSIRFDDDIAEIIFKTEGDSFNSKFENLVLYCYKEKPKIKDQINSLKSDITRLRKEIEKLQAEKRELLIAIRDCEDIITINSRITILSQHCIEKLQLMADGET